MSDGFDYSAVNINSFLLAAIPAVLNIALALYAVAKMPNRRITNVFFLDLFVSACWQASNAMMRISADAHTAMFWDNVLGGIGLFSATLIMHFTLLFINPKKLNTYLQILYPSYFIILVFALLYPVYNSVDNYKYIKTWGWINTHQQGAYSIILAVFLQLHYLFAIGMLSARLLNSKRNSYFFYQTMLLDIGYIVVVMQAIVTESILPLVFKVDPLPITSTTVMLFTITSFIAVSRFNLFGSIEFINKENLLEAISDIVIVIGKNAEIEFINNPGAGYTGYTLSNLRGKPLSTILKVTQNGELEEPKELIRGAFAGTVLRNIKCKLLAHNGETASVLVSCDTLYNKGKIANALLLCRYIDDIEKAEQELKRRENRFVALIEKSKDAMLLINQEGEIQYSTSSLENVMGYSPDEAEGTHFLNYIHEDYKENTIERFKENKYSANGLRESYIKAIRKDGTEIWLETIAINHFDTPGVQSLLTVIRDITEKHNIQVEKEKSLLLFQSLIQNMKDAVMVGDPSHRVITANKEFCNMFQVQVPEAELPGTDCSSIAISASHLLKEPDAFLPHIIEVIKGGKKVFHDRVDFADGRIFERNYIPIFASDGTIEAHLWQYVNITERVYHIQEIHRQSAHLERLFQASPIGIVMLDVENRIVNVNYAFERMFGYVADEIKEKEINGIIVPEGMEEEAIMISTKSRDRNAVIMEVKRKRKDGHLIDVSVIGYPIEIDNKLWGSYAMYVDISAQKASQHEILEKNLALTKINEELDKFVYSVSHDIRSPLMSILGLVNMAESEIADPTSLQYFDMVKNNVNRLDAFTMDIINYSRNARTDLEVDIVNIKALAQEIVESLQYHEEAKDLQFKLDIKGNELFATDRSRLYVVLSNLVSNAIKYQKKNTAGGYIKISGGVMAGLCTVVVEDNGEGIALEKQHAIFEMFTRYSENSKGSGLGLYIVKENLARLNGNIDVESQPGHGTKFTIVIPEMA